MDPLSALGLASNIAQLLEFGGNLISGSVELYRTVDGVSSTNAELKCITDDLVELCHALTNPQTCTSGQYAAKSELALIPLSRSCIALGDEFLSVLRSLKVNARHKKFDSVRQALRSEWKKGQILDYQRRLEEYRSQMMFRLIEILRTQQSGLSKGQSKVLETQSRVADVLDNLAESHRRLEIAAVNGPAKLRREILDALQQATRDGSEKTEAALGKLTTRLPALIQDADALWKEMKVIESLLFDKISERQLRITDAHPGTYDWIFNETKGRTPGAVRVPILDWLRTGSGVYWVNGKAGSGKSTLMKYLHNSRDTMAALCDWAGEKRLVTAGFFFWNAGTDMQNSQQGLLQTLLYNVLRQDPALVPFVCTRSRWDGVSTSPRGSPWALHELLKAFRSLGTESLNSKFCFLVDGLDEYDGDHTEVIKILGALVSNDIKVLFTSRPWNVFEKAYGENYGQKLELQSHTQGDIARFVTERLCEDEQFRELKARDGRYDELVTEITDRASGVFLWVFLVIRSLRRGLTNEDTIVELQERLRTIPTDLEEYFQRMLDSVDRIYHKQAARLYLLRLAAPGALTTMTISYFDEESPDFALKAPISPWEYNEPREICERTRTRVMARCTDLLEFSPCTRAAESSVDFLHRTVHDFLETRNIRNLLTERAGTEFEADRHLYNAMLSQIKRLDTRYQDNAVRFDILLDNFMFQFSERELRSRCGDGPIVDELDRMMNVLRNKQRSGSRPSEPSSKDFAAKYPRNWLITEAMKRGLYHYVAGDPFKLKLLIKEGCPNGIYPLSIALRRHNRKAMDPRIVRLLLDQGANPNHVVGGTDRDTIWLVFIERTFTTTHDRGTMAPHLLEEDRRACVEIAKELLLHGADPDVGKEDGYFSKVLSDYCTPEEAAYLEDVRAQQGARYTYMHHLKKWLPWLAGA